MTTQHRVLLEKRLNEANMSAFVLGVLLGLSLIGNVLLAKALIDARHEARGLYSTGYFTEKSP